MRNFLRINSGMNIMPLLLQLYSNTLLWGQDNIRSTYAEDSPHVDVDDILLRFSDTSDKNIGDELQCEWNESISRLPYAKDIAFSLMSSFRGEQLGRVMITRLAPGKSIKPHADTKGRYANFYTRIHVPLISDPGVMFYCGEESVNMQPGEAWWFNGHALHSVVNNSARDRINLIVDLRT